MYSMQEKQEENNLNNSNNNSKRGFIVFILNAFEFIKTMVIIVALAFAIRVFVIQPFIVEGESMEPTFQTRDYLITEKISYRFRTPKRGEIVIFNPPDKPSENYIKRIIALPGDQIAIKNGNLFINDKIISEPYINDLDKTLVAQKEGYSTVLKEEEFFVMGDNRSHSRDSREIGSIPKQNIVSRVWFRLLPLDNISTFQAVDYSVSD